MLRPLGQGSFGDVYEAIDLHSGQHVAVKELARAGGDDIARFKHEFRALADCHHPNLVGLKELIEDSGRWLILMELVPGMDFIAYVRQPLQPPSESTAMPRPPANDNAPAPVFDEARLRGALAGIAEGLMALHGYGLMHRDLKPSNVRVRPDGRAVLLDFGLATSVHPRMQSVRDVLVGTVSYMAPEQAAGIAVGPAADLYALGVCLFEALTGELPFSGTRPVVVLTAKQEHDAPRASSLQPGIPADLDALCARLLARDPAARPAPAEVLAVCGHARAAGPWPVARGEETPFTGREAELALLERALERTQQGEPRVVLIEGESGVGKSELVRAFARRMRALHPNLLTLRGRCYENEQVSYKAFDGCVDELSTYLQKLSPEACARLLPVRAALLGQLFPVLRELREIAKAPREGISADPTARRLEAFGALAALLAKLAMDQPLVMVIDDLQWADAESFRLLTALVQEALAPPLLLLATLRPRDGLDPRVRAQVERLAALPSTSIVELSGLPQADARSLARELLGARVPEAWLTIIADETQGNPLFIGELVQFAQRNDLGSRGSLSLDAALSARIVALDARPRALLEAVALAARPHGLNVFGAALGGDIDEPLRRLLAEKLVSIRKGQQLACYHDRIRQTVSGLLDPKRRVALHGKLAWALSATPDADSAEQARHWELAGEPRRAVDAYTAASAHALDTLAFARAADLCARAKALLPGPDDPRVQPLTVRRAHALACAGMSAEAAELYREAADRAQGDDRIRLRSNVAQQLMLSARIAEGVAAATAVLRDLGVSMPVGRLRTTLRYWYDWVVLALRGRRGMLGGGPVDGTRRLAVEVLSELLHPISIVHPLGYVLLPLELLRLARGLPQHIAIGLTMRGWSQTARGKLSRALPLLAESRRIIAAENAPVAAATQAYLEGAVRLNGLDYQGAAELLLSAHVRLAELCPDRPWLVTTSRYHLLLAWYHVGRHDLLASTVVGWLAETRERNDALGTGLLMGVGHGFVNALMRDAPEQAEHELSAALARIPAEPFSYPHWGELMAMPLVLVYRGGAAALHWLDAYEAKHQDAFLMNTRMCRERRQWLRGLALLRAVEVQSAEARDESLRAVRRLAEGLERTRSAYGRAMGALLDAQVLAFTRQHAPALACARTARARFADLHHHAQRYAAYLEGLLEQSPAGTARCNQTRDWLREQGWRNPGRGLTLFLPLIGLLEPSYERRSLEAGESERLFQRYEVMGGPPTDAAGTLTARDVHTGRLLALKQLGQQRGIALEQFKQVFRLLSDLRHPNVVAVDALFEHGGRWYMALEHIDGPDLLGHVRPDGRCHAGRLLQTFEGLARGLAALHEAGFVHRDVRPDHVRVAPGGRAVLCDFGLMARLDARFELLPGSVDYAAPEQLAGAPPHPSADVYALGCCLYRALHGVAPFTAASPVAMIEEKRRRPPRPRATLDDPQLAAASELALRALAPEPADRPVLDVMLALFAQRDEGASARSETEAPRAEAPHFCGRELELRTLGACFEETCDDGFTIALVCGESGVGKSSLVATFAARTRESYPLLLVLSARCYQSEQIALKAFDGAVDQLAELLRSLPNPTCESLLPRDAALLAQLFPVLTSVPAIAHAQRKGLPADPGARRIAARASFVELLERLAAVYELLLIVDDVQWADAESFALLRALAARAETLPFLCLCTTRPDHELPEGTQRELAQLCHLPNTEVVTLEGLRDDDAGALARALYGPGLPEARLDALVRESKGHPLFLRELVEHERSGRALTTSALTLDDALRARVAGFDDTTRALLALVALGERPHPVHVYANALVQRELPRASLDLLLRHHLLQYRGEAELTCFHDRIRQAMLESLGEETRRGFSRAMARALSEMPGDASAECARHWEAGGDPERATESYEVAGDRALAALAFDQAAALYARALALIAAAPQDPRDPRVRRLIVGRAHALVRGGQSAAAADLFQQAAAGASGEEQVRLRLLGAQHRILGGDPVGGLSAAGVLLAELGLALPESEAAARARVAAERLRMRVTRRPLARAQGISQRERLRLDALHDLSAPIRDVSFLSGSALVAQYLRRALAAGEPLHTARALANEALWREVSAPGDQENPLFAQAAALATGAGDPSASAEVAIARGVACLARNQFRRAPEYLARAHELIKERCPGEPWLLSRARMYLGRAWFHGGDLDVIASQTGAWIDEARSRDDRYALVSLTGFGAASIRHLLAGSADDALEELDDAHERWPEEPFTSLHFGAFVTRAYLLSSKGPGDALARWLDAREPWLRRAYLMRTPTCREAFVVQKVRAALLAMDGPRGADNRARLAEVQRLLRELGRHRLRGARAMQSAYAGMAYAIDGRVREALAAFDQARAVMGTGGWWVILGLDYLSGRLTGGEAGRALCDGVLARLREEGWRDPHRGLALRVPVLHLLE